VQTASPAMQTEQQHLDLLYRLLDAQRRRTQSMKDAAMYENDGTPAGLFNRDALQFRYAQELAVLAAAEDKLCFGRLDTDDGGSIHIGRLGLADDSVVRRQVLMDWRAPLAAPFYTATALEPQGVVRRRHLRTAKRKVLSVSDEFLQASDEIADAASDSDADLGVGGDSALLEALNAPRTGRMGDIIETIQAEQDAIIRADRNGVLVVQGGPGTGKTVVALHRAAYLLYTHRERLGSHGVLVIGPSRTFLGYIGQVLPSLGETSVVLATIGTLLPGIVATAVDDPEVARLKGQLTMATVVDNAVLDRQRMPRRVRTVSYDRGTVRLEPSLLRRAQRRAWATRRPHNRARAAFVRSVIEGLARQVARRPGVRQLDPDAVQPDLAEISRDLAGDTRIQAALADLWPPITPQALVGELLADPRRLAVAAPRLRAEQRRLLLRPAGSPFTVSDVPLLDEAAELLGEIGQQERARRAALAEELAYAQDTLQALGSDQAAENDSGIGFTLSMLQAEDLVQLHDTDGPAGQTADRAAADREWTYGHVVVDEAQELSPMAWRSVFRRCPLKSMTVVGDVAQTSDAAGSSSWASALNPHAQDRWRRAELTVNYRTPAEIMTLAAPVLAAIAPALEPPSSVRKTGQRPWVMAVAAADVAMAAADAAAEAALEMSAGQVAVLHGGDDAAGAELLAAVRGPVPDAAGEAGPGRRVVVLAVREAKGLEFDRVILVEPARIAADGRHGLGDLYVAMTRATQQLGIVHSQPLPDVLDPALLQRR